MRFTGARILRDGALQERSIAIAEGRITKGPLPAVDMSGYLILPGVIDMMAARPLRRGGWDSCTQLLEAADRTGAAHGVTTQCLQQGWSWEGPSESPEAAEELAAALAGMAGKTLTDLRLALRIEHAMARSTMRILELVRGSGIELVLFSNRAATARDLRDADPPGFAALAARTGRDAAALSEVLDGLAAGAPSVPRALCDLAEQFDTAGVIYGSAEDESGEAREHHSMIGAGLCMTPSSYRAAAAARAVCDPVAISARELTEQLQTRTLDPEQLARCDAIVSDGARMPLADLALHLAETGILPLPRAWALVSDHPARLLRLPGRGRLDLGARADLAFVNEATGKVEATVCGGRLSHLCGAAAVRFLGNARPRQMAAE
ncbi:alkylphosphonate utilization protein [Mangrovicoccus sp. HB161399]|uniref:alkylphosphonate utilization protein n=1 Tax=Mangrovicoccus sp. HB161399 TaxID=2720392 RepID=UPI0015534DE3|nr:alkylphosphonate utilization protein [Mangrovicoccus sp. HB161399]